jgi:hypothetical protein
MLNMFWNHIELLVNDQALQYTFKRWLLLISCNLLLYIFVSWREIWRRDLRFFNWFAIKCVCRLKLFVLTVSQLKLVLCFPIQKNDVVQLDRLLYCVASLGSFYWVNFHLKLFLFFNSFLYWLKLFLIELTFCSFYFCSSYLSLFQSTFMRVRSKVDYFLSWP